MNFIKNIFTFFKKKPVISVIKINGIIGSGSKIKSEINFESIGEKIEEAFNVQNLSAVVFVINSPGGSPVQSELIFNKIRYLANEKNTKVLVFIEDIAASGGYWIACVGDIIYAAKNSIIGSIGVVSSGFGFHKAIDKIGIERRIYTQGSSKSILDPFLPEKTEDIKIIKDLQKDIYENFKSLVLSRRKEIDIKNNDLIFSGAVWSSQKAKELGLIDEVGDCYTIIRSKYGKKIKIKNINFQKSWIKSLISGYSSCIIANIISLLEEKYINSKYGL